MFRLHIVRQQSRKDWRTSAIAIQKTILIGKDTHVSSSHLKYVPTYFIEMLTTFYRYDEVVPKEWIEIP